MTLQQKSKSVLGVLNQEYQGWQDTQRVCWTPPVKAIPDVSPTSTKKQVEDPPQLLPRHDSPV